MPKYAYIKKEIKIPVDQGVSYKLDGKKVEIKGPKGKLVRDFSHAKDLRMIAKDKETLLLEVMFPKKFCLSIIGTIAGHLNNMILGVMKGFKYKMKIAYAHVPITVKVNKDNVEIQNFMGERAPRVVPICGDVKITASKEDVVIEGIDKEIVGQNAANIQRKTRIRRKDSRVFQDGIYVYEKWAGDQLIWHVKI
ncbi:MAG: 50S ribosomal protein L6 [Promethearchaeota archaeon]